MTIAWDAGDDFARVVDTLEPVTVRRRVCGGEVEASAWRYADTSASEPGADGAVTRCESVWQLRLGEGDAPLAVGDRLLDASGACWTVVEVERLRGATRTRLTARRVVIASADAEWYDLERLTAGPSPEWRPVRPALRGCVYRAGTTEGAGGAASSERLRLALTDPVEARAGDRFRAHTGAAYRVVSQDLTAEGLGAWGFDVELAA